MTCRDLVNILYGLSARFYKPQAPCLRSANDDNPGLALCSTQQT